MIYVSALEGLVKTSAKFSSHQYFLPGSEKQLLTECRDDKQLEEAFEESFKYVRMLWRHVKPYAEPFV